MKLTEKDIATLKYEKRIGYVISAIIFSLSSCIYIVILMQDRIYNKLEISIVESGILLICILLSHLINRNLNKDLASGAKIIKIESVKRKESTVIYEAGSGAMYIPGLASISSRLWGQKMRELVRYDFIINNYKYIVDEDIYNKVQNGDSIEMHYSKHSETLLGFEVVKN